jgi:class 3 adenylate cyclase
MAETPIRAGTPADDPLAAGRAAIERHAWREALDRLREADAASALLGADLESLSTAAAFSADAQAGDEAKERAYRAYVSEGNLLRAAYLAVDIAHEQFWAGRRSMASAWMRKAEQHLKDLPESYAHGYLVLLRSELAATAGNLDDALTLAEQAIEIGDRATDADLRAFAQTNLGFLKISSGDTDAGFALMEEASIAAVNDELSPLASGITCCRMISACRDLTDYQRATEWIEATESYCKRQSVSGFPGVCRIHRAEVKAVHGAWDTAEQELVRATDELGGYNAAPNQAEGYYAIGDIRRLRGDFAGAEEALREAHARGKSPQPALALIRLAEGKTAAALKAINAAVDETDWDRWTRSRLLPAQVEIAVAAGDRALARAAIDELATLLPRNPAPALEASRQVAVARVLLAEGDGAGAGQALRSAIRGWREVGAPYEAARARALLSSALRLLDDEDDADLELQVALEEFRRLGASVDAAAAERAIRVVEDRRSGASHVRMTFMFTDIVGSTALAEALGDADWERLLRWHDDTLRRVIATVGGEIVNSTGDGFFAAFDDARRGIDCAIAIQRALRAHRDDTGFAIAVRIGLHTADANRRGADYSGMGVHVTARVTALAVGGEIVATSDVVADAGEVATTDVREVAVKGVSAPIQVASISWA